MTSPEYHKIQTIWLRDPATKHQTLLEGEWAKPEFGYLADNLWEFTEKVDGTNIRIALVLYGEGYGAKIQKGGGNYMADRADFALFDVWCGGIWLKRPNVEDIAGKLEIGIAPLIGRGTLRDAIDRTRKGFNSRWGEFTAEGIVCRPAVELINRRGERVITKIKVKDFGSA